MVLLLAFSHVMIAMPALPTSAATLIANNVRRGLAVI